MFVRDGNEFASCVEGPEGVMARVAETVIRSALDELKGNVAPAAQAPETSRLGEGGHPTIVQCNGGVRSDDRELGIKVVEPVTSAGTAKIPVGAQSGRIIPPKQEREGSA